MDPAELRASIPALEDCVFLNTGASGPSPRSVVEAITEFHRQHKFEAPCGEGMYPAAEAATDAAREHVADFVGAEPSLIAFTRSTTEGINHVADAIDWDPGDVVVTPDFEHPAGELPWERLEDVADIEHRIVETEAGRLDVDDLAAAAADARLVCCSSLTWTHGTRVPVADVVEAAHDQGALVLIDAVQSVGQVPVDVRSWGADFVAASGHKWLLGPWGSGFLYVDPDAIDDLEPTRIGYSSVQSPTETGYEFRADARRFELGTTAIGPYVGLAAGIDVIEEVGLGTVQDHIRDLTDRLKAGLGDRLLSPRDYESGLVTFEADDPVATVERLAEAGIRLRDLPEPEACRASVHAFNTREDVDRLLEAL